MRGEPRTDTKTLLLTSVRDPVNTGVEVNKRVVGGVYSSYSDATDGYPAFNTLPGVLATVGSLKARDSFPDAYSTTS